MRLIGFCGAAGSGKTTAAGLLVARSGFARVRFADPLKGMLRSLGLTDDQLDGAAKEQPCRLLGGRTPRQAMQSLGTEWGRWQIGPDFWVDQWRESVLRRMNGEAGLPPAGIVADDVRFPNEAAAIRALGGLVVRLERPGAGSASGGDHVSEQIKFPADATLLNVGKMGALRAALDAILEV